MMRRVCAGEGGGGGGRGRTPAVCLSCIREACMQPADMTEQWRPVTNGAGSRRAPVERRALFLSQSRCCCCCCYDSLDGQQQNVWEDRGVGAEPLRAVRCLLEVEDMTFSRISMRLIKLLRPSAKHINIQERAHLRTQTQSLV